MQIRKERDEKAENRKITNLTDFSALHSKCTEIKAEEKEKDCHLYLERLIMLRNQTESQAGMRCIAYKC